MWKVILLFSYILFAGCGLKEYHSYKPTEPKSVCFKDIYIDNPEPTLRDIFYKSISNGVLQSGNKLECDGKQKYNLYASINSVSFFPIGYSPSQRANVYSVEVNVSIKIEDVRGNVIINKNIREKTQYIGTGLRADFEKRYAFEEIGNILKVRVFSIMSEL
jgi:hypothetical protein